MKQNLDNNKAATTEEMNEVVADKLQSLADSGTLKMTSTQYWTTPSDAARTLGSIKSERKAAAVRENGKRGGRPLSRFRLDYYGGAMSRENKPIRYRRFHETLEAARAEHVRIRDRLASSSSGIIYGPGLPQIGIPA